ncbi:membrane protein insertase YidC, partial [Streptococcus dysgalactiae]
MLFNWTGWGGMEAHVNPKGMIWECIGKPSSYFIEYFANNAGLGYG